MPTIKVTKSNHAVAASRAVQVLHEGGIIVFPTETCYGIGVDATNAKAIARLFEYKARREGKPLSVVVADRQMALRYVEINEIASNLYDNYLPGPITVVSKGLGQLVNGVESEFGTLGIRIPDHDLALAISRKFGKPFTATSANVSYMPRPYSIASLKKQTPLKSFEMIDLILDAGRLPQREPSTVVDTTMNNLNVMRKGKVALDNELKNRKTSLSSVTHTADETVRFGRMNMLKHIDASRAGPLVFFLNGELGSGKTQFSKGIAMELGIRDVIKSPTFTILNEYPYATGMRRGVFVHIDTWRTDTLGDLESVGLDGYLTLGNVVAIEWADKFFDPLKAKVEAANGKVINVLLAHLNEDARKIECYE